MTNRNPTITSLLPALTCALIIFRYEDFFSRKKNKGFKEQAKSRDRLEEDSGSDDEQDAYKKKNGLSMHEKELDKLRSKIEQMEKANLDPKVWKMRGEVTAAQRENNSALEVDLDFEHNVRPAPVITEEVTASLEDLIKTRISELEIFVIFLDVCIIFLKFCAMGSLMMFKRLPLDHLKHQERSKGCCIFVILQDENKSKKGLAEVYEEEFVLKTDPASAPLSFSYELKKEVVEDMSIQTNVPALAMEEIAPMAVSDAAMLAPEDLFASKGDIKEEAELTKAERKRRRANKKRKFKAEAAKRMAKKPRENTLLNGDEGKEE
ncbi:hypothetical protein CRYUN_Cryun07bG0062400 [Craigia yunnanensis]